MSRLTGNDAKGLMEAYSAVYAPQELTEEQVWEEVENWVNSLVEEGYDLSEYTWEEMYEAYLSEAPLPSGNFQQTRSTGRASSETRNLYRSSSDGKVYRNYNDALAARNSRLKTLGAAQQSLRQMGQKFTMPGAPGRPPAPTRPAATTPARPAAPATRPAAPAPRQQAPARPATTPPTKPSGTASPTPATAATAAPSRPSLASQAAELRQMRAKSLERQGKPLSAATVSATAKPTAYQANDFDPFDIIKGHLLDEGYADTEEAALKIMANMGEEWKKSIIEG